MPYEKGEKFKLLSTEILPQNWMAVNIYLNLYILFIYLT